MTVANFDLKFCYFIKDHHFRQSVVSVLDAKKDIKMVCWMPDRYYGFSRNRDLDRSYCYHCGPTKILILRCLKSLPRLVTQAQTIGLTC